MSSVSINALMEGFSSLLHHANPSAIPEFMAWVDQKVASYKRIQRLYETNMFHDEFKHETQLKSNVKTSNVDLLHKEAYPYSFPDQLHLFLANKTNHLNNLTLNVPFIQPSYDIVRHSSPGAKSNSPLAGSTPLKEETQSALRKLLQGSGSCVNLNKEFEKEKSDVENLETVEKAEKIRKNSCNICGKAFLHRSSYRRHLKLHQGVFTHECPECKRKFSRREHFARHKCSRKSFGGTNNNLDISFESVSESSVPESLTMNTSHIEMLETAEDTNATEMSSNHSGDDNADVSSVSSGQISPPQGSECSRRSSRKSSVPRKLTSKALPDSDEYLSDLEESMYDGSVSASQEQDENVVLDMSVKKREHSPTYHASEVKESIRPSLNAAAPSSNEPCIAEVAGLSSNVYFPRFAMPTLLGTSPPPGFRIGDFIESAVTKYSGIKAKAGSILAAALSSGNPPSPNPAYCSSPKMKAKLYSKLQQSSDSEELKATNASLVVATANIPKAPKVSNEGLKSGSILATETGTYQITTEQMEIAARENTTKDTENTPSKCQGQVIKVVKQGNYLKLKKEAKVIDGELRFICPHCNKVFHRSSNFSRHMRIHRGVFSYICSSCQRGFYRKEHYDKHKCYRKSMATTWERKTKVDLDNTDREQGEDMDEEERYPELPHAVEEDRCDKENAFTHNNLPTENAGVEKKASFGDELQ